MQESYDGLMDCLPNEPIVLLPPSTFQSSPIFSFTTLLPNY